MTTKVKGEAIKEGSIPYNALATEVKNKIENAGGGSSATPDWEASEGEAGYIENKPFGIDILDEGYFNEKGQKSVYFDVPLYEVSIFIDNITYTDLTLGNFTNGSWPVELEYDKKDGYRLVYTGSGGKEERFAYEIALLKQISEVYIPSEIVRTEDFSILLERINELEARIKELEGNL